MVDPIPPLDLLSYALRDLSYRRTSVCSFTGGEEVWEVRRVPNGFQVTRVESAVPVNVDWQDEPLPFPTP